MEVLIVRGGAVPSGFSLPLWQSTRLLLPCGALLHQLRMVRASLAAVSPLSLAGGIWRRPLLPRGVKGIRLAALDHWSYNLAFVVG